MAKGSIALVFLLNILFFNMVRSGHLPCPPIHKTPSSTAKCPRDTLKLGVCVNVLNNLVSIVVGAPPKNPCCSIVYGLSDLEAAVCLCTALKGNALGVNLNVPVSLTLLLNYCGKEVPAGYQCA